MYVVKSTRHQNGERFLNLLNGDGVPLFWPTVWTLTDLRGSGKSINTISQALTSLKLVYDYLDTQKIDLDDRLQLATFLERNELEGLYRHLKKPLRRISNGKVVNIKKFDEVSQGTFAIRLIYAHAYFIFLIENFTFRHLSDEKKQKQMSLVKDLVSNFFKARKPSKNKLTEPRIGLNKEQQKLLTQKISVDSISNPWKSEFVRERNELIVQLLLNTGMRRGEVLCLKTDDLNIHDKTIKIEKNVKGLIDTRTYIPKVKTVGRVLIIDEIMVQKIQSFIMNHRRHQKAAQKHPLLFTSRTGNPLSLKSVNAIFNDLKTTTLGFTIYPHLLRHTYSSNLYRELTKSNIAHESQMRMMKELLGWSLNSQMPALYGKGHIREMAKQVILDQQKKMEGK
jgi:integrase